MLLRTISTSHDAHDCLPNAGCPAGTFDCGDGGCVPSEKRCDFWTDCKNKKDEMDCKPEGKLGLPDKDMLHPAVRLRRPG